MFKLFLILVLINFGRAITVKELGIKFLNETDDYEIISANSLFEYGKRHNILRYFGVAKNEKESFRFDICAPIDDCLTGYGYIEICFLTNTTTPKQKGKCPKFFSSFKIQYFGEKKAFTVSETINSESTYFKLDGNYEYKHEFHKFDKIPKHIKFYRKGIRCITAYHEIGWEPKNPQIRFAQPDDLQQAIAYGADPWITLPFDSEIHPFQTVAILQDSSTICAPSVYVNLPEYIRIESSKPTSKTTTTKPETTNTNIDDKSMTTPTLKKGDVTETFTGSFISSDDWIPLIIVIGFLCLLIPQFVIGSIILNKRSSRKSKKLYLMVLEKRENVRKEIQQNQKEALEAEKRQKAKTSQERKRKINQMKKQLMANLPEQNKNEKVLIQTPKTSKAGSSRIGKREVLPRVENIGDGGASITGASKKETEESNIQLVKGKTETSKTGSISTKAPSQKQSFSAMKTKEE